MLANYHTHTVRCRHAYGSDEEYIRAGIKRGLQILGFSDHTPSFCSNDYRADNSRMLPEELPEYVRTMRGFQERWKEEITIKIGLEAEYRPSFFVEQRSFWKKAGVEYLLLGQHMVDENGDFSYCVMPSADAERLKKYCYRTMEAMNTGVFTYFAHPDILHFTGDEAVYDKYIRELCREANRCHIPLEINLMGIIGHLNYPKRRFWELAASEGCMVLLGCDAHRPERLLETAPEAEALAMVEELGLVLLETVPLRPV